MIKRSQYLISLILMAVVFMLFVMLESVGGVVADTSEKVQASDSTKKDAFSGEATQPDALDDHGYTAVLASEDSDIGKNAALWCTYQKRTYVRVDRLNALPDAAPAYLILDPKALDYETDISRLTVLHDGGTNLIFAALPDYQTIIKDVALKKLLGIEKSYGERYQVDSVKLFGGFLLGGIQIFEKMHPKLPYFTLLPGGKVYMVGMLDAQGSLPNEMLPPLIWRYSDGGAPVFVVNGGFCADMTALGIYSAMLSETESYSVYPVVNAQNMVTLNYPNVSTENSARLRREYSMDAWQLSRDYLWQNIGMIYNASGDHPVYAVSPQLSGGADTTNHTLLSWYAEQLKKQDGELIYSAQLKDASDDDTTVSVLTRRLSAAAESYGTISAMYSASLSEGTLKRLLGDDAFSSVRTVVGQYNTLLGYFDADTLALGFTYNAYKNSDYDHLRMISVFTALGYSSVSADAMRLYYPESEKDTWSVLGDEWSSHHVTWWKPFSAFDTLNVTDTDSRVRRFLSVGISSARSGDCITVTLDGFSGEAYFILRLTGEKIVSVAGGTARQLEDGAWMIHAEKSALTLTVAQEGGVR